MTSPYRIAVEDITEAMERAQIGPDAFQRVYTHPRRLPGWCVRLTMNEVPEFAAELVIAVAQRKAIEDSERPGRNQADARDDTVEVRKMLRRSSEVTPDPDNALLLVLAFPGCDVVDKVEEATL